MDNQYNLNGHVYSFSYVPPRQLVIVQALLAQVIGASAAQGMAALKNSSKSELESAGAAILSDLLGRMDGENLLAIIDIVFKYASCDQVPIVTDSTFAGRPLDLWKVLIYGLRYNLADFLPASLLTFIKEAMSKTSSLSNQQT